VRFIIRKFIDAPNLEVALRKERRTRPHEAYLDNEVWKEKSYSLNDEQSKKIGFKDAEKNRQHNKTV